MRFLSLFSGIEAASVAWLPLGWTCVAVAEIDPFPCALLAHHYPDVPNLGSVTEITESDIKALGHIDVVVFGFPCQDLSVAGKRAGLKGERSGLFYDAMRIVRWSGARWSIAENVPGLFSTHGGRDFASVVGEMAGAEFAVPPDGWRNAGAAIGQDGLVEWSVLDAQFWGVAQRRRRVFLVRDIGDWSNRPPVLFERESLQGHPAPSRETGQGIAACIGASPASSSSPNVGSGQGNVVGTMTARMGSNPMGAPEVDGGYYIPTWPAQIAPTLNAAFGDKQGLEDQHALNGAGLFVPHVLSSGQANASVDKDIAPPWTASTKRRW